MSEERHAPVVIAVDGSPASNRAARVGVELAAALGVGVVFVHGSEPLARELFAENPNTRDTERRLLAADPVLRDAVSLADEVGVTHRCEVVGEERGDAVAADIVGVADGNNASLIVVGTRGHGNLASAVLGSVSRAVLDMSDVPVVVVSARPRVPA